MSIRDFSALVQSEIFKDWLKKLESNLLTKTVEEIRSREQRATKTDFALSTEAIKKAYKSVTNKNLSSRQARAALRKVAELSGRDYPKISMKIGRSSGILFEEIGFDTITKYVRTVFDELDGVKEAYKEARDTYIEQKTKEILAARAPVRNAFGAPMAQNLTLTSDEQKKLNDEVKGKNFGFGNFVHKGHVISIATNSAKSVRQSLIEANDFSTEQKNLLVGVLDKYIDKLQKDDLASANLPDALNQKIYAKYIKSHEKYLVEIQLSYDNLASGSTSLPIVNELRDVFSASAKDLSKIMRNSPTLGRKLLDTQGSPSYLDLLAQQIKHILDPKQHKAPKTYTVPKTLVASNKIPIKNKRPNKKNIEELKKQRNKIKTSPKIAVPANLPGVETPGPIDLNVLLVLINTSLADTIKQNMGSGDRTDILNLRTGRFAESVEVKRLSQSRAGMITAFYSYMKNPYATFSSGGRQEFPRSRDPKLLIAKSIREIAAENVENRMRSVLV